MSEVIAETSQYHDSPSLQLNMGGLHASCPPLYVDIPRSNDNMLNITVFGAKFPYDMQWWEEHKEEIVDWVLDAVRLPFDGQDSSRNFTRIETSTAVGEFGDVLHFRLRPVELFPELMPELRNLDAEKALMAWFSFFLGSYNEYFCTHSFEIVSSEMWTTGTVAAGAIWKPSVGGKGVSSIEGGAQTS